MIITTALPITCFEFRIQLLHHQTPTYGTMNDERYCRRPQIFSIPLNNAIQYRFQDSTLT
jgi:hypothetical protein